MKTVEILMVEDNRGDVVLVEEAMAKMGLTHAVTVVTDGVEAMDYLCRRGAYAGAARPDLIVLDLKLPRKSGREVLEEITRDPALDAIPIVIVSSSRSELEIARSHGRPEVRCMAKPATFAGYVDLVTVMEEFRCARDESHRGDGHGHESDENSAG
jgi:CheY-like chemotaxis protein